MGDLELRDLYNHDYDTNLYFGEFCYEKGKADRDKEIAEHNVFFSNKPIEDIVLEARADERANLLKEICSKETVMIDIDDGKAHFVVKSVDIMKVFNEAKE